ncbi:MAG: FG-GAP repeat domain-containing protein, partial [Thermoanaerobaculia bacterium]
MKAERSLFSPILVSLALTLPAGLLPPAFSAQGSAGSVPLNKIYSKMPSYQTSSGSFSSGILLVDLDKDGYDDLVLSNGIDVTPQPLAVYYNRLSSPGGTLFGQWPNWYSQRIGYQVAVASGDLNQDGWLDLIVLEAYNLRHEVGSGGFAVLRNDGKGSFVFSGRIPISGSLPLGCTLADVDADGDLDLAVAVYTEKPGSILLPGRGRVYLN